MKHSPDLPIYLLLRQLCAGDRNNRVMKSESIAIEGS